MISRSRLKVSDIATTSVLTITAETPLHEAIQVFVDKRISCLVVASGEHPEGIVTERDLLRLICAGYDPQRPVRAVMSAPLMTARQDLDFALAWNMLSSRAVRHMVLVDDAGRLRGVVSATDFRRHIGEDLYQVIQHLGVVLNYSDELIDPERPLAEVLEIMASRRLDHVIIGSGDGIPLGILTERDVPLLMARQVDIHRSRIRDVMSQPLQTVPARIGVAEAARHLNRTGLRHLVAVDKQGSFAGVISQHRMLERLSAALLAEERDQLAQQVVIGEQRFRSFVENMQLPLCHVGAGDQLLYINHGFELTFGWQAAELPDLGSWWELSCPDPDYRRRVIDQWRNAMQQSRLSGLPVQAFEQRVIDRLGADHIVEVSGTTLGDEFLITLVDVTTQHRQQQQLEIQARRAQALLELPRLAEHLDESALLDRAQALVAELTGSEQAFLHLLDEQDGRVQACSWSGCATPCPQPCLLQGISPQAGMLERPQLFNEGEAGPRYSLPDGCLAGQRMATLPLYENGLPVMLVGVYQRERDYSSDELETLQLVAGEVWRIIQRRRTSEALRTSEASLRETAGRLQEAQRIARIGDWVLDAQGSQLVCSGETLHILELHPHEFTGRTSQLLQRVHPDDSELLSGILRQLLLSGQSCEHSFRLRMPDGSVKHVQIRGEARLNAAGQQQVIGTLQDVTEQRAVELALSALATTLAPLSGADFYAAASRHLAEALGLEHVFVGHLDACRDQVQIIAGWSQGQPMQPLTYTLENTPCANVMKRSWAIYPRHIQQLYPQDQLLIDMNVESYIGSALFDKQQQPVGILVGLSRHPLQQPRLAERLVGLFVDRVSAEMLRQQAEHELRESEQHFRTLANGGTALIWTAGPERYCDYFNEPWLRFTGCSLQQQTGNGWMSAVHPQDLPGSLAIYNSSFRQRLPFHIEYRLRRHDGSYRWISDLANPRYDSSGQFLGYIGFAYDITERKEIEVRLLEYKTAVEQTSDGIVIADMDGQIRFINAAWAQMHGYAVEDLSGRPLSMFHSLQQLNDEYRAFMQHLLDHGSCSGELGHMRRSGELFPAWATATILRDAHQLPQAIFMSIRDITSSKQAEDYLRQAASVFEHASEGILITDASARILDVNNAFCRITGYSRKEVIGKNPRLLKSGRQKDGFYDDMWRRLLQDGHWSGEQWNRRKDGEEYVELLTISAIRNERGEVLRYVGLFSDITPLWEQQNQLKFIAHNDALTHLPNRVRLAGLLKEAMEQASDASLLAVAYLDLDGFKSINDLHGHAIGDELLISLSRRMEQALRPMDNLARLGGDEFVAVLPQLPDQQACIAVLDRLLAATVEAVNINGMLLHVSSSIGVSFYPQPEEVDADQLLRQADQAMYQAKQAGKNRYHLFDAEHDREVRGRHESIEHVRVALAASEFVLHYQPKVNLRSGAIIGVEALVRWQHPQMGLLPPSTFLPVIETHQLSVELGYWVMDEACRQFEAWLQCGLHMPVSVNINAIHALQPDFIRRLRQLLERHPAIRPGDLELEILETSAFQDLQQMSRIIEECRELGVRFSLDDFGTGYSSLTYLKHLPVQLLKIDQSFVHDMLEDPDDMAILDGILSLAGAFQREVIAEGVETAAHAEMLLQMGCEYGQGYAIARPMPAGDLLDWAARWQGPTPWQGRPPVDRYNLQVLYAMVDHRAWINNMAHCLRGGVGDLPPLHSQQCRLGQWLHGAGVRHAGHPLMPALLLLHEDIHRHASHLLQLQQDGQGQQALEGLPELEALRDQLLALLQQLID